MYTSPVAHRTRNSTSKLLDFNKRLSNNNSEDTGGIKFCGPRTAGPENDLALNASVAPKVDKNVCDVSLNATVNRDYGFSGLADAFEMERVHVEGIGVSHDKVAYREPKRRKNNIDSENQINDSKMDNHSKSVHVIAPRDVKLPVQRKKHRVFIRSIADILDTVKRRRRSVTSSNKFESDGLTSNVGKMPIASHKRTRSSLLSDILKPYLSNDSHFKSHVKPSSDGTAYAYSVCSVKQVVHLDNPEKSKEGAEFRLFPEVAKEYIKAEGSLDAISQPSLTCSPTIGINAVSPVCISPDISKISAHKSLSRSSLTRELIRLEATSTSPSKLNDMRRKKDMGSFQICFSNHLSQDVIKQQKKILARLEIKVVSSASKATHFVTDKFVRTRNMLEAMAMGKPVVTTMWLESCGQASCYIDERNYILRDAKKEKEIGFSMPVSLARACQHPLLQGKMLFITQNTKPNQELISSLVTTAGGQLLKRVTRSMTKDGKVPENLLIVAGEEDFAVCAPLLAKGAAVFSSELLLNGIVVQKLEYERHQLFLDGESKL
ncbi:hypothetical protein KSP40_PGU021546 [Platanthera guangdongensis]|uniref:BRCT domain-containing protein n=1 Tax=Platanthera guangdongensis TaxID=2320717 RepID=A0ABR2LTU3_9ASPA